MEYFKKKNLSYNKINDNITMYIFTYFVRGMGHKIIITGNGENI